jgi:ABC-type lipoprotein release transport system permease subunit
MKSFLQDLRYGLRQLRNNRGFAVTAIITLSLGIGASAAIFAFVDAALIKPLILGEAGTLALIGIAAGLVCSFVAAILMRSLLFGVRPWDVPTFVAVAVVLGFCALLASYIPARRAARVDPMVTLRYE